MIQCYLFRANTTYEVVVSVIVIIVVVNMNTVITEDTGTIVTIPEVFLNHTLATEHLLAVVTVQGVILFFEANDGFAACADHD